MWQVVFVQRCQCHFVYSLESDFEVFFPKFINLTLNFGPKGVLWERKSRKYYKPCLTYNVVLIRSIVYYN